MDGTVIVADDDKTIRTVLAQAFTRAGCKVRSTGTVSTLWRWIEEGEGDVVVSDVMLPDGNGLDILPKIHKKRPNLPVIIISAQNTVMTAIKASENGAYDYLPKPFDLKELLSKVSRALNHTKSSFPPHDSGTAQNQGMPLIGSSAAMQDVYRIVARVLNTDLNVLITGESGTGKNLLAQILHDLGDRGDTPLMTINSGMATAQSVTSILYDADKTPTRSTVYLDKVDELSEEAQIALLDAMQSNDILDRQLRFICSTQNTLVNLVNEGLFREDLYYRLTVMPITLPPLRDRMDDIPELVRHFLYQVVKGIDTPKIMSAKAIDVLRRSIWSGNIRELENFIERAALLCPEDEISADFVEEQLKSTPQPMSEKSTIDVEHLSSTIENHLKRYFELLGDQLPPPGLYNRIIREIELPLIALTLARARGNQIKTAELLGINRNTLRKKINDLDIQVTRTKKMM